ncbi:MAG: hypothetical protein QX203_16550 [Methylococcaceae bacterium]
MSEAVTVKSSQVKFVLREIVAVLFWIFLIVKLVVFDLDIYIVEHYIPSLHFLLDYKLFIFLGLISFFWIIIGKKEFPIICIYIAVYPLVVMFWKLPVLCLRNWSATIVMVPATFGFITNFRLTFISYALAMIASVFILESQSKLGILLSMIILFVLLVVRLWISLVKAYKSTVFSKISFGLSAFKKKLAETSFLKNMLEKTNPSTSIDSNKESFNGQLSMFYLIHSVFEFMTEAINDVMKSRKMDLYLIFSWLYTYTGTAFIFSFEYLGLYKINPKSFSGAFEPNFLSFLGFSLGKLTPSSVSIIIPMDIYAISICYAEVISSLFIIIILIFTILTAARERYKEDMDAIIEELNEIGELLQNGSQQIFKLAISEIELALLDHNQGLVSVVRKLRSLPELPIKTDNL